MRDVLDHRQIMRDEQVGQPVLVLQIHQEIDDLGLDRDVERRDRLVADDQLRAQGESAGDSDLILTSAGVSVGDLDHTRDVFAALGGAQKFWKVKMRPGAPLAFGMLNDVPWLGVSGNPVSAMVSFELFVRPVLRKMQGHSALFRRTVMVTVETIECTRTTDASGTLHFTYHARLRSAVLPFLARDVVMTLVMASDGRVVRFP